MGSESERRTGEHGNGVGMGLERTVSYFEVTGSKQASTVPVMGSESTVMGSNTAVTGSESTVMGSDTAVTGSGTTARLLHAHHKTAF